MPLGTPTHPVGNLVLSAGDRPERQPLEAVRQLAESIGTLIAEIQRAQTAVWQRDAELAAGIPVTIGPEDRYKLATRLESVLTGGAKAIGCQAAALYLLDDATSHLKLRAAWQLPSSYRPARPVPSIWSR